MTAHVDEAHLRARNDSEGLVRKVTGAQTGTRVWRYGWTRRLVAGVAAGLMLLFGVFPLLIAVALVSALNETPTDWVAVGVLTFLGTIDLPIPLAALLMIRAAWIAARVCIELRDGRELHFAIPTTWVGDNALAGANPLPPFRRVTLPVSAIQAVEIREEVNRFLGIVSVARSLSVLSTDGERFVLGFAAVQGIAQLPLDEIAQAIATAADRPIRDRGIVETPRLLAALKGQTVPWDGPTAAPALDAAQSEQVRSRAALIWQGLWP